VSLVYNEFKSVLHQKVVIEPVLPIGPVGAGAASGTDPAYGSATDYLYEPSPERILSGLLEELVRAQVFRALLESNAAFFAAQMMAMDSATRNSAEMIEGLTLSMNKIRQAAITREIIEVVSGAQAL
ncbi:MAG TPA: FoF1 ATP synthase subunit gamma, partial [Vicinamibacterales bacterium]